MPTIPREKNFPFTFNDHVHANDDVNAKEPKHFHKMQIKKILIKRPKPICHETEIIFSKRSKKEYRICLFYCLKK